MRYLTLIHIDPELLAKLPDAEYDRLMRGCFEKADALRQAGCLQGSQQLEAPATARTLRVRDGIDRITDGPFVETREFLAGFNLIEADSMDEAMEIARQFPWARFGSIEVRPVRDMQAVRDRVGARAQAGRPEPGPETEVAGPAWCAENRVPQGETIRTGGPR